MTDRWKTLDVRAVGRRLVSYGPFEDRLPARFTATTEHVSHALRVRLDCSFDGKGRVSVDRVCVEHAGGGSVAPEDMVRLQLARLVYNATMNLALRLGARVESGERDPGRHGQPLDDDELRQLARQYWTEYVAWGHPRQTVMAWFGMQRATANRWIRRARDRYGLPGVHADGSRD